MLASALVVLALAVDPPVASTSEAPSNPTPAAQHVARAINAFGLDLYAKVAPSAGNVFLSPASVAAGLELASAGAAHATAKQMDSALHLAGLDRDAAFAAFGELLRGWNGLPATESTLAVVNRAWGTSRERFHETYLRHLEHDLGASLQPMSFAQPEDARKQINAWVAEATHGRINDLLPPGSVARDTRLVLTDAAYFLGQWSAPFAPSATHDAAFHLASGESPPVPMMHQRHDFRAALTNGVRVLEMPYGNGAIVLDALLPDDPQGLPALESSLDAARLEALVGGLTSMPVEVALPRFTMRSELTLNRALQALGIVDAFSPQADFGAMSADGHLAISQVVHQAFVETDEKGTVAAAATAVVLKSRMAVRRNPPFEFRADHPFLILVRDSRTGAILFLGRVADPRS